MCMRMTAQAEDSYTAKLPNLGLESGRDCTSEGKIPHLNCEVGDSQRHIKMPAA